MKLFKNLTFIIILIYCCYTQMLVSKGPDLIGIYEGIPFECKVFYQMIDFLVFACYCFYIFNEFESYLYQYGIFVIVREKSRLKIFSRMVFKVIFSVLLLELIRVAASSLFLFNLYGKITTVNPVEILQFMVLRVCILIFMLLLQMFLEIYLTGKVAIFIIMGYYLASIGFGSILAGSESFLSIGLLPNLSMKLRLDEIFKIVNLSLPTFILSIVVLIVATMIISNKVFLKKDII